MIPEILAPAQDVEGLLAAVEAGADAVYAGLKTREASGRGAGFTPDELARGIAHCRARGVKVYVTLNRVFKESELSELGRSVAAIGAQGAHGVIVEDLGAAALIPEVCPGLALHAGPGLAVHNIEGVRAAARLGCSRVVLARELTAFEVREIALDSPVELEIFVHGSLCFSMAGLCLTSSFLSGRSGNRGRCLQACRRPYLVRGAERYAFSMADLSCARGAELLRSLPVAAWVIEGRLRSAAYVRGAVAGYRAIRDGADGEAGAALKAVKTRPVTSGFLGNAPAASLVCPDVSGPAGVFAGRVGRVAGGEAEVRLAADVAVGQRLRVQGAEDEAYPVTRLRVGGRAVRSARVRQRVMLNVPPGTERGDLLFAVEEEPRSVRRLDGKAPPWQRKANTLAVKARAAIRAFTVSCGADTGRTFTVQTDDLAVARAAPRGVDRVMLVLTDRMMHALTPAALGKLPARVGVTVPPVTLPERLEKVRRRLRALHEWGVRLFEINNLGGFGLLPPGARFQTGPFLYVHNRAAAAALRARGAERMVFPLEGDAATLADLAPLLPRIEVVAFSYVPLFVSRAVPAAKSGHTVRDGRNELFHVTRRDDLVTVYSRRPYCIFSKVETLAKLGVRHFRIVLAGVPFAAGDTAALVRRFREGVDVPGATPFNMVHGLK